jgi:hypothetical protein
MNIGSFAICVIFGLLAGLLLSAPLLSLALWLGLNDLLSGVLTLYFNGLAGLCELSGNKRVTRRRKKKEIKKGNISLFSNIYLFFLCETGSRGTALPPIGAGG